MLSRRSFLATSASGILAAASRLDAKGTVHAGCQTNAWAINPSDFSFLLTVLGKIKGLGFEGFETGFRNVERQFSDPAGARAHIEKTGLQFFGVHIFLGDKYDPQTSIPPIDLIAKVAKGGAKLGAQRVIVSGAPVTLQGKINAKALRRKVAGMNAAGSHCRKNKLAFCYHNHSPEFMAGGAEIQELAQRTNAGLVDFLIDAGHAYQAHGNVISFFARYASRIVGLHLRDSKQGEEVPLGQGEFDYHALAEAVHTAGWTGWVLAEEERLSGAKLGESAARPAREYIRRIFGV
jgi:sugar phosphate isomerase/epimerase